jgi:hypothetical protein
MPSAQADADWTVDSTEAPHTVNAAATTPQTTRCDDPESDMWFSVVRVLLAFGRQYLWPAGEFLGDFVAVPVHSIRKGSLRRGATDARGSVLHANDD